MKHPGIKHILISLTSAWLKPFSGVRWEFCSSPATISTRAARVQQARTPARRLRRGQALRPRHSLRSPSPRRSPPLARRRDALRGQARLGDQLASIAPEDSRERAPYAAAMRNSRARKTAHRAARPAPPQSSTRRTASRSGRRRRCSRASRTTASSRSTSPPTRATGSRRCT